MQRTLIWEFYEKFAMIITEETSNGFREIFPNDKYLINQSI